MTKGEAQNNMGDEIRNFSVITAPGKTHFSKVRITLYTYCTAVYSLSLVVAFADSKDVYTGKIGGFQDDVVITLRPCSTL